MQKLFYVVWEFSPRSKIHGSLFNELLKGFLAYFKILWRLTLVMTQQHGLEGPYIGGTCLDERQSKHRSTLSAICTLGLCFSFCSNNMAHVYSRDFKSATQKRRRLWEVLLCLWCTKQISKNSSETSDDRGWAHLRMIKAFGVSDICKDINDSPTKVSTIV